MGTSVPLRKSPDPIVLCLSASQTGPSVLTVPQGFLDTVPVRRRRASRSLQSVTPRALVAFLARCVVVNSVLALSGDWLRQLSPKTTLSTVTPQIASYFCPSAKKRTGRSVKHLGRNL